jgi:putative ABC transport system substrate-binding protein
MGKPAKTGWWGTGVLIALVALAGLAALPWYFRSGSPSLAPKPVKLARTQKVAVIRLGDPSVPEPPDSDIADGLRYAGLDTGSFALVDRDAKGDRAAAAGLVDSAVGDGADILITLLPETTVVAAGKGLKIPLVFHMAGEPVALGLGASDTEHQPNLTGAYTSFRESLIVMAARACLPKARKIGILFNPDDRYSVIHKDTLLKTNWYGAEPVTAEFHSESEVPSAVRALIERKAEEVILVTGIGQAAGAAIAEARRAHVPVFGCRAEHARAGAILAKEPSLRWGGFEAGRRAGRVLKGEPAGRIPFIRGGDYVTYVNTGAAKGLNVTIFGELMRNAREVTSQ